MALDLLSSLPTMIIEEVVQPMGLGAGREELFLGERFPLEVLTREEE